LMMGVYHGIFWYEAAALVVYLFIVNYILLRFAVRVFENKIVYQDRSL